MSQAMPWSTALLLALMIGSTSASATGAAPARAEAEAARASDADAAAARRAELEAARAEMRALARRIAELARELGEADGRTLAYGYLGDARRALIGVVLGTRDDGAVELRAVTPGGPADRAGLRSGDKLVAINGRPVAPAAVRAGDRGYAQASERALAAAREQIGRLAEGDAVRLTVERDGKPVERVATAERRVSWEWPVIAGGGGGDIRIVVAGAPGEPVQGTEDAQRAAIAARAARAAAAAQDPAVRESIERAMGEVQRIVIDRRGAFFDLRLADLNPSLGRYFGSERGVLVLDKGADTLPGLEVGDVILAIDGQRVDRTGEAMRALAERADRKGVAVEVLRDRRRHALALDVPPGSDFDVLLPLPPAPPAPPAPPTPPAAAPPSTPAAPPAPPRPPAPPAPPVLD